MKGCAGHKKKGEKLSQVPRQAAGHKPSSQLRFQCHVLEKIKLLQANQKLMPSVRQSCLSLAHPCFFLFASNYKAIGTACSPSYAQMLLPACCNLIKEQ